MKEQVIELSGSKKTPNGLTSIKAKSNPTRKEIISVLEAIGGVEESYLRLRRSGSEEILVNVVLATGFQLEFKSPSEHLISMNESLAISTATSVLQSFKRGDSTWRSQIAWADFDVARSIRHASPAVIGNQSQNPAPCPICRNPILVSAQFCPMCGHNLETFIETPPPPKNEHRQWGILISIIGAWIAIHYAFADYTNDLPKAQNQSVSPAPSLNPAPSVNPAPTVRAKARTTIPTGYKRTIGNIFINTRLYHSMTTRPVGIVVGVDWGKVQILYIDGRKEWVQRSFVTKNYVTK